MFSSFINYFYSTPLYLRQLDCLEQKPGTVFNESEINTGFSLFLEEIKWNIAALSEKDGKKYAYFQTFKDLPTQLTIPPYYLTHLDSEIYLQRIIQTFKTCTRVRALLTKKGVYSMYSTTGYLAWERRIYNEANTENFYKDILAIPNSIHDLKVSRIHTLCFKGHPPVSIQMFNAITKAQPRLKSLDISVSTGNQDFFNQAINRLNQLVHLKIHSDHLNDQNLQATLCRSPGMESLDISGTKKVSRFSIINIGRFLPSLKSLNVTHLPSVDTTDFQLLRRNQNLTELYLDGYESLPSLVKVISQNITESLRLLSLNACQIDYAKKKNEIGFINLRVLSINSKNTSPQNDIIIQLAKSFLKLQILSMEEWVLSPLQISDFKNFKSLKELTIGNFPHCESLVDSIAELNEYFPDLKVINSIYQEGVTERKTKQLELKRALSQSRCEEPLPLFKLPSFKNSVTTKRTQSAYVESQPPHPSYKLFVTKQTAFITPVKKGLSFLV